MDINDLFFMIERVRRLSLDKESSNTPHRFNTARAYIQFALKILDSYNRRNPQKKEISVCMLQIAERSMDQLCQNYYHQMTGSTG